MDKFDMFRKRLGFFVHWGIYAVGGCQEQEQGRLGVDASSYEKYAQLFNPSHFDPDAWIDMALNAGMSYMVFTAKHHDGFCMWDTKATDYNIMNTPYGRDILKMLADACAKRNFPLGIYYSNPDWHHPHAYNPKSTHQMPPLCGESDFNLYIQFVKEQITELMTNYGRIVCLFWDIPPKTVDTGLQQLVRDLQPGILINDRGWDKGDYATPERALPDAAPYEGYVEACQSIGRQSWGYRKNEDYFSASFLQKSIGEYLLRGANFLLNIGPMESGAFPDEGIHLLNRIGSWYKNMREAYEAQWLPQLTQENAYYVSGKGDEIYLHIMPPVERTGYEVPFVAAMPKSVTLLNTKKALAFELERFPVRYSLHAGNMKPDCLHIHGLPADELNEPMIVKISGVLAR
ncbi:MAG: alpha-L-fucosidase [Christensenellales bacterium]|jgi:alpha-L-fucosidase